MALDTESFNKELYDLLKVRGYKPVPLNSQNQRVKASQEADVIEFQFNKDGKDYGKAWVTLDDAQNVIVYFDDEQQDSPSTTTPGVEYDDSWTGFLKHVKQWAQRRQLSFELSNKDRLGDDMRQREYYKMKEKLAEGYHPMGKKASYNDAVPSVKIILQHNRALEEGEQRYRNVSKIFLENTDGERFLAPTTRPGLARVYARHIAEGGVPNDERWNHIKSICEDYSKMAGFVRATRGKQFNESAQLLINEGVNHYNSLRETLSRMTGHRGYTAYFEAWTPTLMEDEGDGSINELFVQETVDPRIESAMPILSRLRKSVSEVKEVDSLAEWAESVINEKLELGITESGKEEIQAAMKQAQTYADQGKNMASSELSKKVKEDKLGEMEDEIGDGADRYDPNVDPHTRATNFAKAKKNPLSKLDPNTVADLVKFGVIMSEEEVDEGVLHRGAAWLAKKLSSFAGYKALKPGRYIVPPLEKAGGTPIAFTIRKDAEFPTLNIPSSESYNPQRMYAHIKAHIQSGNYETAPTSMQRDFSQKTMPKEEAGQMDEDNLGLRSLVSTDPKKQPFYKTQKGRDAAAKKNVPALKADIKATLGKHPQPNLPEEVMSEEYVIHKGKHEPGTKSSLGGQTLHGVSVKDVYTDKKEAQAHADAINKGRGYKTGDEKNSLYGGVLYQVSPRKGTKEEVEEDLDKNQKDAGQLGPYEKVGPKGAVGKLVGGESAQLKDTPLIDKEDYVEKRKTLQKIQMDPDLVSDPKTRAEVIARLDRLNQQAKEKGLIEGQAELARLKELLIGFKGN